MAIFSIEKCSVQLKNRYYYLFDWWQLLTLCQTLNGFSFPWNIDVFTCLIQLQISTVSKGKGQSNCFEIERGLEEVGVVVVTFMKFPGRSRAVLTIWSWLCVSTGSVWVSCRQVVDGAHEEVGGCTPDTGLVTNTILLIWLDFDLMINDQGKKCVLHKHAQQRFCVTYDFGL